MLVNPNSRRARVCLSRLRNGRTPHHPLLLEPRRSADWLASWMSPALHLGAADMAKVQGPPIFWGESRPWRCVRRGCCAHACGRDRQESGCRWLRCRTSTGPHQLIFVSVPGYPYTESYFDDGARDAQLHHTPHIHTHSLSNARPRDEQATVLLAAGVLSRPDSRGTDKLG